MKKLVLLLAVAFSVSMFSCGGNGTSDGEESNITEIDTTVIENDSTVIAENDSTVIAENDSTTVTSAEVE